MRPEALRDAVTGGRSAAPSVGLPSASCSVGLGVAVAGWAAAVRLRPSSS